MKLLAEGKFLEYRASYSGALAAAYRSLGRIEAAQAMVRAALDVCNRTGEQWWTAELMRILGDIEGDGTDILAVQADQHFTRSLLIARAQEARSWELRTAMSIAVLRNRQGRGQEGRALLTEVYRKFSEGFETADLVEARRLLAVASPADIGALPR
jgi:predicted ATPase